MWGLSNLYLMTSPFVHIPCLLPGLEIDYSSLPHPDCQETIEMHTPDLRTLDFVMFALS